MFRAWPALLLLLFACEFRESVGELPDGSRCLFDADCNSGNRCVDGACRSAITCAPKTCAQLGRNCGPVSDGCGTTLQCGSCSQPSTCGGGGMAGVCGVDSCGGCFNPPQ